MTHPVDLLWDRIEAALSELGPAYAEVLAAPASRDALAWLEAVGLPDDWLRLFARHDGERGGVFLLGGYVLCPVLDPVDSVASEREGWLRAISQVGLSGASHGSVVGPVRNLAVHDRWIPIGKDFGGNVLFVDLDPADGGRVGQVVELDHEVGLAVRHSSAEGLLQAVLARVQAGELATPEGQGEHSSGPRPVTFDLAEVARLAVGDAAPLGKSMRFVRLDPRVVTGLELADPEFDLVFAVESLDGSGGDVLRVDVLNGTGQSVSSRGEWRWVHSDTPLSDSLGLRLLLDLDAAPRSITPLHDLERLSADGSWEDRAARGFRLRLLGRPLEALAAVESALAAGAPSLLNLERADLLRELGRSDECIEAVEPYLPRAEALAVRAQARLDAGHTAAGREDLEALLEAHASPRWSLLAARRFEQLGEHMRAAAETERAMNSLPFLQQHYAPRLALLLERRRRASRASSQAMSAPAAVTEAHELPHQRGDGFVVEGRDVRVTVDLLPTEAREGLTVQVDTPDGRVGVSLPPGAGHGAAIKLKGLGVDGLGDLVVTVAIRLPDDFEAADGCANRGLEFERWDCIAWVDAPVAGERLQIQGLDAVHEVEWGDSDEVRVSGAGLARPRGTCGDLVVRVRG